MTEIQFNEWINKYEGDKNGEYTSYISTEELHQFCKDYTKQKLTLTSVGVRSEQLKENKPFSKNQTDVNF